MIRYCPRRGPAGPVAAALLLAGALSGCSSPSSPARSPTTTWSVATPDRTGSASAGVAPSVGALPSSARIRQVPRGSGGTTRVTAGDGGWMISRPEGAPRGDAEVLHLDAAGRILRAYPFPGLAPQWLLLTPRAVYCGRHGLTGSPDAMVCRIDRTTGDLRGRVWADLAPETAVTEQDVAGRPGTWALDGRTFAVDLGIAPTVATELVFRSRGGVLRLDPDTLAVLGS